MASLPNPAVFATADAAQGEKRLFNEQIQATLTSVGRSLGECRLRRGMMNTELIIRRCKPSDRSAIDALNRSLQAYEASLRLTRIDADAIPSSYVDEIFSRIRKRIGGIVVAEIGVEIVGFIAWIRDEDALELDPPEVVITDLVVSAPHRRSGVGRKLLKAAEAAAVTAGITRISVATLSANTDARAAYEAMGFHQVMVSYEKHLRLLT
ncbi:MAG: GNAT family N-acetyltransferase [Rhodobacteraceae bacterium]|nr:GNAT family N-acetyltransferase [Paracoccaceae bacterium]